MDFSMMVHLHIKWLSDLLTSIQQSLDVISEDEVERDDACEIGKWLQAHKEQYGNMPEFEALNTAHAALHKSAAAAVRIAHAGKHEEARAYLSPSGAFIDLSSQMINCAGQLFPKINHQD